MSEARPSYRSHLLFFLLLSCLLAIGVHGRGWLLGEGSGRAPALLPPVHEQAADTLPDFAAIDEVEARKALFFDFLQPYIDAENRRILAERRELERLRDKLRAGLALTRREAAFISTISEEYQIATVVQDTEEHLRLLLRRVDILPSSLVLAQAANESAWGTSRFALEGRNFFGQWCYSEGCGLVPQQRHADAAHEVQSYASVADSVRSYFMNINTFPSYLELRRTRQRLRDQGKPLDSHALAEGLERYSERGWEYVKEVRAIIQVNELHLRDREPVNTDQVVPDQV